MASSGKKGVLDKPKQVSRRQYEREYEAQLDTGVQAVEDAFAVGSGKDAAMTQTKGLELHVHGATKRTLGAPIKPRK